MSSSKSGSFSPFTINSSMVPPVATEATLPTSSPSTQDTYMFFEPDTKLNIIHVDNLKPDHLSFKTTKCASLTKIIERITLKEFNGVYIYIYTLHPPSHHASNTSSFIHYCTSHLTYSIVLDEVFVKDFLCTYRDYTTPLHLLKLLKLR